MRLTNDMTQAVQNPKPSLASLVIPWQLKWGRSSLAWQSEQHGQQLADPYGVWVSEVMLQQTQVAKVAEYFPRFVKAFPDVSSLATASREAVLAQFSGLGYYRRAHNLHLAAIQICDEHGGQLPQDVRTLQKLPGIGRSTAGAITSLAYGVPAAVLDANVRRVLNRVFDEAIVAKLWHLAEQEALFDLDEVMAIADYSRHVLPALYTQAMMDLGATLCEAAQPKCHRCPLQAHCCWAKGEATAVADKPPATKPLRKTRKNVALTWVLPVAHDGTLLLQCRPREGIWPQLWTPLQGESLEAVLDSLPWDTNSWESRKVNTISWTLTHRQLSIDCWLLSSKEDAAKTMRLRDEAKWPIYSGEYKSVGSVEDLQELGMPSPARRWLEQVLLERNAGGCLPLTVDEEQTDKTDRRRGQDE